MATDLNIMATNIKNILSEVSGILIAYDHEPQNIEQLPAATLYFDGFDEQEETIGRLQYDWRWTIRIYVPMSSSDVGTPQITVRTLTTNVLTAFRDINNFTIGGTALLSRISTGEIYNILNQTNAMMVSEITLVATTQESR